MKGLTARDVMTADVMSVQDTMTVRELANLLIEKEVSGMPVTDANGQLVGVVSVTDLATMASDNSAFAPDRSNPDFFVHGWEDELNADDLRQLHIEDEGLTVADIMTPTVYTVDSDQKVAEVAKTMVEGHLHRLLVVEDRQVIGIVTTLDLLKELAQTA